MTAPDEMRSGDSSVPFYRGTKDQQANVDEMATDGCSKGYLISPPRIPENEVTILRMKLPYTFIRDNEPDLIFGEYDCQEFTISSNLNTFDDSGQAVTPVLDFWSVNSRMLNQMVDANGYIYVFFAPNDYVQGLVQEQSTPPTVPPVLTWGLYTGFVLGPADGNTMIRYRSPADSWQGNPLNCICYLSSTDNQPVNRSELGEWLPEMYGDSMVNFENGCLGPVSNNSLWPVYP